MTSLFRNVFLILMITLPFLMKGQCDVYIVPGSVEVSETDDAVMFTFDVTNDSNEDWMGDDIRMAWSLNSGANIMSIQYGDGSDAGHPPPLAPGQVKTFNTPWMAIPNLPSWFPDEQPSNDNPWLESMDWPYYTLPFPFNGAWSPINLRLASCGLGDGAWVYNELGEPYFGPQNDSVCQDLDNNAYCDCDIEVTGYDQDTYAVSIDVNSSYNCGCNSYTDDNFMDCYDSSTSTPEENTYIDHLVFGLNVQTLDENWLSCMTADYHPGWLFGSMNFEFQPVYSGDMVSEQITLFNDCWQTMQDLAPNSLCLQMVVWQINFSATTYNFVDYNGPPGWAATCGTCTYDVQAYPDIDISDNLVVWCFDEDPPEPDIPGCIDPEANNYNSEANLDDDSCTYDISGCVDPVACNYNSSATIPDSSCIYCGPDCIWENPSICNGCLDPEASNYNETAIYDDGSCEYLEITDISLDTILYVTGCDQFGPYWNPQFYLTNEGNVPITEFCIVEDILGTLAPNDTTCFDITIQPGETYVQGWPNMYEWGVLTVRVIDVNGPGDYSWYDFGQDTDIADNMYVQTISDAPECNSTDALPESINEAYDCINDSIFITNDIRIRNLGTDTIWTYCIEIPELNYDECFNGYVNLIFYIEPFAGQVIFNTPPIPGDLDSITIIVYGVNNELLEDTFNNVVQINFSHENQPEGCDIQGCTIEQACNYNPDATLNDNSCDFESCAGCMDPEASNYDPEATIDTPGLCEYEILGCTDINAINYSPLANTDDGSCIDPIVGCMIPEALNYDPIANVQCLPIMGGCCIFEEGCMDEEALNYNPDAWFDDGSCEYDVTELTYVGAECNVDCDLSGPFYYVITTWTNTGNVEITNFCAEWNILGSEGDVQECYNGSLMPGDTVLLLFGPFNTNDSLDAWAYLQVINEVELVPQIENYETLYCYGDAQASCVYGCTDQDANNYDATADVDDGSCTYDVLGCTDLQANNYNPNANIDDGSCTFDVLGCTDPNANNFNSLANVDDGSCQYNVLGCTDQNALNFSPFANIDDGSCLYYDPCDEQDIPVYVPNVFTPNGDGINDVWLIVTNADCWLSWDVKIFNRWGNMIYEMNNPNQVWDGTIIGSDRIVSDGVYICRIIARGMNARVYENTTEITVFK